MATFQSKRTQQGAIPRYKASGVFSDTATYTFAGEAAGSVINMLTVAGGDAPAGITVLDVVISNAALGAGVTGTFGDPTTPAQYVPTTALSTAGVLRMTGFPKTYLTDTYLTLTTAGAAATGV